MLIDAKLYNLGKMSRFEHDIASIRQFAELILDDASVWGQYEEVKAGWLDGQEQYPQQLFSGFSIAKQSLIHIAKRPHQAGDGLGDFFVGTCDFKSSDKTEHTIGYASLDAGRRLWLRVIDRSAINNWASGKHPEYHKSAYEQKRFEINLGLDGRAAEASYTNRLAAPTYYEDIAILNAMIEAHQQSRQSVGQESTLPSVA